MDKIDFNPGWQSVDEVTIPEKLNVNTLQQLDNMVLDKQTGNALARSGLSRYNPNQVDTSGIINNLFDVNDVNSNNFLLANIGTKLRKSTGGTGVFSDLKTGLTANQKMRSAAFGNNFLFTNGVDKPFYTDLTTSNNLEVTSPDSSAVSVVNNSFQAPSAGYRTYLYTIVFVTTDGQDTNPSISFFVSYAYYQTNTNDVTINNLPVSADSRVTSKMIFRTKNQIYDASYLLANIDNSVTSYIDTTVDSSLDTTTSFSYLNVPESAKFICANNDRIFLANVSKEYINRVIPPARVPYASKMIDNVSGVGNIDAGQYYWGYSIIDNQGNESALIPLFSYTFPSGSAEMGMVFNADGSVVTEYSNCSMIYFDKYLLSLNTVAKTIRFYRTHKNESTVYYFLSDQSLLGISSLTDDANDSTLTITYPKSAHSSTEIVSLSSSVIFSNLNTYLEFPELNYIEIYPDDSDQITGIFDDDNGIVIFKQNSICKLYTNGDPTNWQVQKLIHNIGCDQPDSIIKYQTEYFFIYKNAVYTFNSQSANLISYKRKTTFDSITAINGAAFFSDYLWYVLSVNIGNNYYLLCYDTKFGNMNTWYKFTISKADCLLEKQFGADKGKLLIGSTYINYYNQNAQSDTDSGTTNDITTQLKTKDFVLDDFVIMRLMFLHIDYYRKHGSISTSASFQLIDPSTNSGISLTDNDESFDESIFKIDTDGMSGIMKRTKKVNLYVFGEAIAKMISSRLDYNAETWGERRKHQSNVQGIGMNTGTNTGVGL